MVKFPKLENIKEMKDQWTQLLYPVQKCNFHTDCDYDTDTTGNFSHINIFQNNDNRFMIEVEE